MNAENYNQEESETIAEAVTPVAAKVLPVVRLLQRMEWAGLRIDHAKLARTARQWWVSEEEQVVGPWAFEAILRQLLVSTATLRDGVGAVTLMPVREDGEEAEWRTLTYSPLWKRSGFVRAWGMGCWVTMVILGWCVVATLTPFRWEALAAVLYFGGAGGWAI